MNNRLLRAATIIVASFASPAISQEATVQTNILSVTNFVKGTGIKIDAEFGAEYGLPVPAPFEFIAPTSDDHLVGRLPAPGGSGYYKVFFATLEEEVMSNIQFIPFTVGMGEIDVRLNSLPQLLKNAFGASVEDTDKAAINATRLVEVGKYQAIEMLGNYETAEFGTVVLRIVAIPNPDSEHGILAIINGIPKFKPMTSVEDIMDTNASRALGTFKFQ